MLIIRVIVSVVAAIVLGKLVNKLKLPAILGWLIAGMIVGPYALGILNEGVMSNTYYKAFTSILECFVGIMIGSELVIKKLKTFGKEILVTTLFQSLGTFVFVSLVFMVVFYFMSLPLYLGFVFGAIALATAPAPALSIIKEFNTKGPVTDTLVPMAALDDVVAIIVFFTVTSLVGSTMPLGKTLAIMILLPILVGLVIGYVSGKLMKGSNKKLINVLVSILIVSFIGLYINTYLLDSPMINFMLLGMAYAGGFSNVIEEAELDSLMTQINPMIGLALVFVILGLGAPLNYKLIMGAGFLTLIYIVSRMIGKYFGARIGAKTMKMPDTVVKYLGLTLLPHSGVSLVFTGIAATTLMAVNPEYAAIIQGTIAAAAILNEIVAVIVSKKAFEWAGELG